MTDVPPLRDLQSRDIKLMPGAGSHAVRQVQAEATALLYRLMDEEKIVGAFCAGYSIKPDEPHVKVGVRYATEPQRDHASAELDAMCDRTNAPYQKGRELIVARGSFGPTTGEDPQKNLPLDIPTDYLACNAFELARWVVGKLGAKRPPPEVLGRLLFDHQSEIDAKWVNVPNILRDAPRDLKGLERAWVWERLQHYVCNAYGETNGALENGVVQILCWKDGPMEGLTLKQ